MLDGVANRQQVRRVSVAEADRMRMTDRQSRIADFSTTTGDKVTSRRPTQTNLVTTTQLH